MKIVIQRVKRASVSVTSEIVGSIDSGLCLLVGLGSNDTEHDLEQLANKVCKLKLFSSPEDETSRWKYSIKDAPFPLSILAISQFTLYARTDNGSKPDFHLSMTGELALPLFNKFVEILRNKLGRGAEAVQTGSFGKYMSVEIVNDGPVTIILESKEKIN